MLRNTRHVLYERTSKRGQQSRTICRGDWTLPLRPEPGSMSIAHFDVGRAARNDSSLRHRVAALNQPRQRRRQRTVEAKLNTKLNIVPSAGVSFP